jgi:hypothetical protein
VKGLIVLEELEIRATTFKAIWLGIGVRHITIIIKRQLELGIGGPGKRKQLAA